MAEDKAFHANNAYVAELERIHGGDLNMMVVSVINAQLNILSSIHEGDEKAVAAIYMRNAQGVVNRLLDGSVELAKGPRH
jgi:hypothetical protein